MLKRQLVLRIAPLLCLVQSYSSVAQEPALPKGTKLSVVLVELFTSEGCSSCPPADQRLREIDGRQTPQGQLVIGISEHVTYWNRLGWTDPYSSDVYTRRQQAYGEHFSLGSVYTPQMVVNGSEQIVGGNRAAFDSALSAEVHRGRLAFHIASAQRSGNKLSVQYNIGAAVGVDSVDIVAAVVDDVDRSEVLRGENANRTLEHVAVARSLQRVAVLRGAGEHTAQVILTDSVTSSPAGHHLILFAQTPRYGPVLGADVHTF